MPAIQEQNPDNLWAEIEALDWERDTSYERIQEFLHLHPARRDRLNAFRRERFHELSKPVWELILNNDYGYVSNDGMDDCINHIIGCGHTEFANALANPALVLERYKQCDYQESFAYAFQPL